MQIGSLLGSLFLLGGCGATGLDWVADSEVPARASEPASMSRAVEPQPATQAPIPAQAEPDAVAEARPRLNHTVTLGEIEVLPPSSGGAAAPGAGVSVTINNYTTVAAPGAGYGYAGFGYARSQPGYSTGSAASSAARSSASGPQAGQSWPSIAEHGSSFPYRSAPASPWARSQ